MRVAAFGDSFRTPVELSALKSRLRSVSLVGRGRNTAPLVSGLVPPLDGFPCIRKPGFGLDLESGGLKAGPVRS